MFCSCQKYSPHKWQYLPLMLAYLRKCGHNIYNIGFCSKFFVFLNHFSHKWGNISKNSWSLLKRLHILDGLHFLPWLGPYLSKVMMSQWVLLRHYNVPILAPFSINIWIRMNFSRVNWNTGNCSWCNEQRRSFKNSLDKGLTALKHWSFQAK